MTTRYVEATLNGKKVWIKQQIANPNPEQDWHDRREEIALYNAKLRIQARKEGRDI